MDRMTKKELLDQLQGIPDNAEIVFSATSWQEHNGKLRQYNITVEKINILNHGDYAMIRLYDEKPED
jgi:hypothetical protein